MLQKVEGHSLFKSKVWHNTKHSGMRMIYINQVASPARFVSNDFIEPSVCDVTLPARFDTECVENLDLHGHAIWAVRDTNDRCCQKAWGNDTNNWGKQSLLQRMSEKNTWFETAAQLCLFLRGFGTLNLYSHVHPNLQRTLLTSPMFLLTFKEPCWLHPCSS